MKQYKVYTKENGLVETNSYDYFSGLTLHREDGPAAIQYYVNGKTEIEVYCINNKIHRLDGPAKLWYNINGTIRYEYYYINGNEYTKEQYFKELLKLKLQSL